MRAAEISQLLSHSSWLRRLARSLVRDDAAAEDLVQETWMAALRSPPRAGDTVRAWLGAVLRNAWRADARGDGRRARRHEAAVDRAAHAPASDELVEAAGLQRDLAELVLALEEPYRATVLLRFYEGLDATEIGARLDVPAGTVRWRLKTALARLRARLDGEHGGDRAAWRRALAPLTAEQLGRAALVKGATAGAIKGALVMKLAVTAAIVLGAAGAIVMLRSGPRAHPATATATAATATPALAHGGGQGPAPSHAATPSTTAAPPSPAPPGPARERLDAARRAEMLARIAAVRRAATGGAESAGDPPPLDKDYIRQQVQQILPLLKECYDHALEGNHKLAGRLMVKFTIVGDSSVGGLVGDSKVDADQSTLDDGAMRECVQETMYALQFPPPKGSGEVEVAYPFVFATDEESARQVDHAPAEAHAR